MYICTCRLHYKAIVHPDQRVALEKIQVLQTQLYKWTREGWTLVLSVPITLGLSTYVPWSFSSICSCS